MERALRATTDRDETAHKHQRRPAVELDAPFERQRAIGGSRRVGLRRQQAGEDHARAGGGEFYQRRCQKLQRPQQDVGEDQIERRHGAKASRRNAVGMHSLDHRTNAVQPGVGAHDAYRFGVDVGCQHALPQGARRRNGEHARAGAEVENAQASPAPRFADAVERQEAAARGAVVAGAEGERCLDLDADPVDRNAGAVVGAVNDKPSGPNRLQAGEALAHPVFRRDAFEGKRLRGLGSCGRRGQRAHRLFVRRCRKMDCDGPASVAAIHKTDRYISIHKALGKQRGDFARRLSIGFQPCGCCSRTASVRSHRFINAFRLCREFTGRDAAAKLDR